MNFRTDLALERQEVLGDQLPPGVVYTTEQWGEASVSKISVQNTEGAQAMGKPVGEYITVEVPRFQEASQLLDGRLDAVVAQLQSLLPESGTVLVVGLGNEGITPDALGPKCAEMILATRHIKAEMAKAIGLGELRPVSGLAPGVLGQTGIETGEIIAGVAATVRPSVVITVDALAARRLSRLGNTVQISNTGIVPGSGVGNARMEINERTLGIPVVSIGVPTVVDATTLAMDLLGNEALTREQFDDAGEQMMVTPREIDLVIERAARLIAMSINCTLQPHIPPEDLLALIA